MTGQQDLWIDADARIDARDELIAKLGRSISTSNDAELILRAYEVWGEDCPQHLLGDFAFAIRDNRSGRLFCARDHFGVKPFFYTYNSQRFIFSANLNALRRYPEVSDELNEVAIGDYLLFGLNQDLTTTTFRDIQRLPAAHSLTIANGKITTRRYWTPDSSNKVRFRSQHAYVERFQELFTRAIKDRLPDDRVSVSMSGGLDSTSIAAVASDLLGNSSAVLACAVVYDRLIPDQERQFSTAAAEHLGIPITHVAADGFSLFDEQVPGDMDQPEPFLLSPLTAQFHTLLRHCAAHGRVALTGFDGDSFMNEPAGLRARIRRVLRKQRHQYSLPAWIDESFARRTNLLDRLRQASSRPVTPVKNRPNAMQSLNSKVWAPLFEGYDPGATKLNLELRHPLIDVRLVEYLLAIPAAPWCVNKHILRLAMQDRLPAAVLNRPKTPLAGDPALQLARSVSVRWLDTFEVNPQLERFVNLKLRRAIADEQTSDGLWANLRVFALNYWLTNSQPIARRATEKPVAEDHAVKSARAIPMTA